MNKAEWLLQFYRVPVVAKLAYHALTVLGVNLPLQCSIGPGVRLVHGAVGLVAHESTVVGAGVKLYQGVTIGRADVWKEPSRTADGGQVVIGPRAVIGAGAVVLFNSGEVLTVGERAMIGANSVVTETVPPGEIWAGVPARRVGSVDD